MIPGNFSKLEPDHPAYEQVVNDLGSIMEAMKNQHAELQSAILQLLPEVSSHVFSIGIV